MILKIRKLKKNYGETKAVVNVNVNFQTGSVHTIFGENGSGKSTVIKILSGIIKPDGGSILIDDELHGKFEPIAMRRKGLATVFQEILIAPNLTAQENIFLGYDGLFKWSPGENKISRRTTAENILERISRNNIDLNAKAGQLLLSQQQIIVIARALLYKPKILILDESTSALDIAEREQLIKEIKILANKGVLVIYISHRIEEVLKLSDKVTILRNGVSVATLSKEELSSKKILRLASHDLNRDMVG